MLAAGDYPLSHRTTTPYVYARQIAPVLVITKNTNRIANYLFAGYSTFSALKERFRGESAKTPRPFAHATNPHQTNRDIGCAGGGGGNRCARPAANLPSRHIAGPLSAMRNEHSGKYTPTPPRCPSCAQLMRLARTTSRFGKLPDLYIFECRACGVTHIDAVEIEVA
jgi:hypothetical protein